MLTCFNINFNFLDTRVPMFVQLTHQYTIYRTVLPDDCENVKPLVANLSFSLLCHSYIEM